MKKVLASRVVVLAGSKIIGLCCFLFQVYLEDL